MSLPGQVEGKWGKPTLHGCPWPAAISATSTCKPRPARGVTHDRDHNAASNILAAGRAERLNARGGDVRPGAIQADPCEAGTQRSVPTALSGNLRPSGRRGRQQARFDCDRRLRELVSDLETLTLEAFDENPPRQRRRRCPKR